MAYGLTSAGFTRPTLTDIIADTKNEYRYVFGQNVNVAENSYLDKIITIHAEREYSLWELMENVYYSQTLAGAEGKYLDDIYSKQGAYRSAATKASGSVFVGVDNTVPYTFEFSAGVYTTLNGTFINTTTTNISGSVVAQTIKTTDLAIGNYVFTITDPQLTTQTLNLSLTNTSIGSPQVNSFFGAIRDFIVEYTTDNNYGLIQIDTLAGILYIGYNTNLVLTGLQTATSFKSTPIVGSRYVSLEFQAISAGYNSILSSTVTEITPKPSGYLSATNPSDFYSGTNVESDAEYRARASVPSSTGAATRTAIINGMYNKVSDLSKVKLFPNPTNNVSNEGVPPYSLMVVTYGGTTTSITQAIYDLIACPTNTYGTISSVIQTEDGSTETVYYTPATEKRLAIRVKYNPVNNKQLSTAEKTAIQNSLITLSKTFDINSTVFNLQLQSAVVAGVNLSRFSELIVESKTVSEPDTSYTQANIIPATTELCTLLADNISFVIIE